MFDPFAGRGTTLYAARLRGLQAFGIDSNPVAAAISEAKLANTSPNRIISAARSIIEHNTHVEVPKGEFWRWAFHKDVLRVLCCLREGLVRDCRSDSRKALRAIVLGALHGPRAKTEQSHFSNQCPRTYAPKPRYAVKYWRDRALLPPKVDVLDIITRRAQRYFGDEPSKGMGRVVSGDSRKIGSFEAIESKASWIVTSPPYYGMKTYVQDQWLRMWFLGGPPEVDYSIAGQLSHGSRKEFAEEMRSVWLNCAMHTKADCRLVIRFGAINDRKIDALELAKDSLMDTPWRVLTTRRAGTALGGKRQADHFVPAKAPIEEYDIWAALRG